VLNVAERLFSERGYTAVTLRDIAAELGMRQASLYHHAPGGKEQLYVDVTERGLARHQRELERAISAAGPDMHQQLSAVGDWLFSQPPINLARMTRSDLPALSPAHAERLSQALYQATLAVLERIFSEAGIDRPHPTLLAGAFLSIVESIHYAQRYTSMSREEMLQAMIEVLLHGLQPDASASRRA
jgi:AcrR family transcriptional regulator